MKIIFTRDELNILERVAQTKRLSPGDTLRQLLLREAIRHRLLDSDRPAITKRHLKEKCVGE